MESLIYNGWVISVVSILITFAVTPLLQRASDWVRSRRGPLTAKYLAISESGDSSTLRAEMVQLRHVGEEVKGVIVARAELILHKSGEISVAREVPGLYEFSQGGCWNARFLLVTGVGPGLVRMAEQ